jgi:methylmalonyl-CoA mutase
MSSAGFLSEFPAVATEDWESAIRASVTESDYPAKLIWHPEEGLAVKPYYRAEDLRGLSCLAAAPGEFPFVRGTRVTGEWRIREEIDAADPEQANRSALDAIAAGAEEISFSGVRVAEDPDLARLLVNLEKIPLRFQGVSRQAASIAADWLSSFAGGAQVSADLDPLANLDLSAELCCKFPNSRLLSISAEEFEESGLGTIEQIAFLLSAGVDFLEAMLQRGVGIAPATAALGFSFAIGPKFFLEIAKLRAFRLAWAKVVRSFDGDTECSKPMIYARTARWNETVYDPHVNILRATTEAMSAAFGGADSIAVTPFDEGYRKPDQASRRLARNLQLLLKGEAGLARVTDPLGGAYLIEAITDKIATKAWKLFQELEAGGGYNKARAEGIVDSIIQRRRADRSTAASLRTLVLTGTNRFANPDHDALGRIEHGASDRIPRVAVVFEELRLRSEKAALKRGLPKIILTRFGDARMSDARAQFAADFLACAGLRVDVLMCDSPSEIADTSADLVVLCSSDREYLKFAEKLVQILGQRSRAAQVAIAGNPECAEDLKRLGITQFIHLRSNAAEVLASIQQKLGIEG